MMKKLLLIAVLMVSTVIFNSGCEKEKVAKSIVKQNQRQFQNQFHSRNI